MSTFKVPVVTFKLEKHPNADSLSLATIDNSSWICVVRTDDFTNETCGVYVPLDSVASKDHPLLSFMEGKKVKTVKLRGCISQGILLPGTKVSSYLNMSVLSVGDDLSTVLGVKKWEPPVNRSLGSCNEIRKVDGFDIYTEIENWKHYPDIIKEGEYVLITEKIHGTSARYGIVGEQYCIGSHRRVLELIPEKPTVWHIVSEKYNIKERLQALKEKLGVDTLVIYGEIFGPKVQDLNYGQQDLSFRVFDIKINDYVDPCKKMELVEELGLELTPTLHIGPFSKNLLELRFGKDFSNTHVREGFVIEPIEPRYDFTLGRVKLKVVSEDYLTRKGGTDYE